MALQLGAVRDALLSAGVHADQANKAAEEFAGYENRITRLMTLAQVTIALMLVLLGSQAGLWIKMGELGGQQTALSVQQAALSAKVTEIGSQQAAIIAKLDQLIASARQSKP